MKTAISLTALALALGSASVSGQVVLPSTKSPPPLAHKSQADCRSLWMAADKNGDGKLDAVEVKASQKSIPAAIASNRTIEQNVFMTVCIGAGLEIER